MMFPFCRVTCLDVPRHAMDFVWCCRAGILKHDKHFCAFINACVCLRRSCVWTQECMCTRVRTHACVLSYVYIYVNALVNLQRMLLCMLGYRLWMTAMHIASPVCGRRGVYCEVNWRNVIPRDVAWHLVYAWLDRYEMIGMYIIECSAIQSMQITKRVKFVCLCMPA